MSVLKWHGGKHYLAEWIISHFPPIGFYAEPFAGGLSVLLRHSGHGRSEVVNDVHPQLSLFWSVLRNHGDEFIRRATLTPLGAWVITPKDDVDRALAFFVRIRQSRQGIGREYTTPTKRHRRGMNENVSAWLSSVDGLVDTVERLRRIEVRNLDFEEFIKTYDHPQQFFYCDPPYHPDTRTAKDVYEYEMTAEDHERLLKCLSRIKGKFALSGYTCPLYESYGWRRVHKRVACQSGKGVRLECLWFNY